MRRGVARPEQDAAGRLLEGAGDRIPREMTVRMRDRHADLVSDRTRLIDRRPEFEGALYRRTSLRFTLATVAATAAAVAACTPRPGGGPAPAALTPRSAATPALRLPPRYTPGHFVYDVQSVGVVSSPRDTSARPDTVATHSTVTYEASWDGPLFRVAGQVRYSVAVSARVQAAATTAGRANGTPGSSSAGPPAPTAPATARGGADSGAVTVALFEAGIDTLTGAVHRPGDSAAVPRCPPPGPVEADETLATDRPRSFAPGTQWTDTLARGSCLGGIPLTTRTVRVATVGAVTADPATGAPSIMVSYSKNESWDGEARRRTNLVTIHATGTGTVEQYYEQATGVLLSSHTATVFDIDATINGRTQYMHQPAEWRAKIVRTKG